PRATRPSSTEKASVLLTFSVDTNCGLIAANTAINPMRRTKGPNSGFRNRRCSIDPLSGRSGSSLSGIIALHLGRCGRLPRRGRGNPVEVSVARHHVRIDLGGVLLEQRASDDVE